MKLLITLGHNASAILVSRYNNTYKVLCGYEEERLSTVKSDSSFPSLSIKQILKYYPEAYKEVDEIFISHWFWSLDLVENKYYRPRFLKANFPDAKITSIDYNNTHHDLHAKSMWNFLDGDDSGLTIVADGFGNFGECLSIYVGNVLRHRSYNVKYSLGLMYQYAIRYLGMKENQDEYKLLGYEQQVTKTDKETLKDYIRETADKSIKSLAETIPMKSNMERELEGAWVYWESIFSKADDGERNRAIIAYFVQQVLERVILEIVSSYNIKNIKVTGGVFYNVKLNNLLLRYSDKFEANPLAGDQGCALGFLPVRYNDLLWGLRDVNTDNYINIEKSVREIKIKGYTEIFRGSMEFGPRALCNTTCLALPKLKTVERINAINGRDTVMPMAPVITEDFMYKNFIDVEKVGKSKYFMIIAYDFKTDVTEFRGAAHYDSDRGAYTGRLQVAQDFNILHILNSFDGILINTSLNAHGQPIIYNIDDFRRMKIIQNNTI